MTKKILKCNSKPTCSSSFLIISVTVYYPSNQYLNFSPIFLFLRESVHDNILSYQTKYCKMRKLSRNVLNDTVLHRRVDEFIEKDSNKIFRMNSLDTCWYFNWLVSKWKELWISSISDSQWFLFRCLVFLQV